MTTRGKIHKILRCDKTEFLGTKDGKEKVIATVSMKDSKVVVESEDLEFKKNLENFLNSGEGERALRWTREDIFGFRAQVLSFQKPGDTFFLEALVGPWSKGELWGYKDVWAREAGKIWEEEVPEEML